LGAQAEGKDLKLCDKCFFMLPDDAEFCPDCGAPVDSDPMHAEGSDAAVYPELARANLLRMRGDYEQAKDVCLSILRRFPNNATANTLIGDICAERGDLEQAAEWYELALDLAPDSAADQQKLNQVRQRLKERQAANTAAQLGLPTNKPKVGLYAAGLIVLVSVIAVGAFLAGKQGATPKSTTRPSGVVNMPVTIGGGTQQQPVNGESDGAISTTVEHSDASLIAAITAKVAEGAKVVTAWKDQRGRHIYLSLALVEGDDERALTAKIGQAALEAAPDAMAVTLRGVRGGIDYYLADVPRDALATVAGDEWKRQHENDPKAFADALLRSEWYSDRGSVGNTPPDNTEPPATGTDPNTPVSSDPGGNPSTGADQPARDGGTERSGG